DKSAGVNSCAMALRPATRCSANELAFSPAPRICGNQSDFDSRSQPASANAPAAASVRAKKRRRAGSVFFMRRLLRHAITAGNHRAQVVPETGDNDFENMDPYECDDEPRSDEMQRSRRLAAAEQADPARNDRIRPWRHPQTHH